jgi:3-oxoacyl-[acyl-carrier protein] reductase
MSSPPTRFAGRTVAITGASRGLGRSLAVAFAREAAFVAVGYRTRRDEAEQTLAACREAGGDGLVFAVDVRDRAAVDAAFGALQGARGGLDVLVNNAGVQRDGLFAMSSAEDWDDVMAVNLDGVRHCTHAVARAMLARRSGAILNVASVSAIRTSDGRASYTASKAGVLAFTRVIARELAPHGVRVNALVPGYVDTGMAARMDRRLQESAREAIPVGRFAAADEVAAAALFLTSDDARYVIGHALVVDGGLSA